MLDIKGLVSQISGTAEVQGMTDSKLIKSWEKKIAQNPVVGKTAAIEEAELIKRGFLYVNNNWIKEIC